MNDNPTPETLFVPPAADGLPPGALNSATEGADRLDAMARTPYGRNLLAHALVQLARDGWLREPAVPAAGLVAVPPTTQTALRDRIRRAICEASGFEFDDDGIEPDEYGEHADAVLAVLPPLADRAAVLREAADHLNAKGRPTCEPDGDCCWYDAVSELRRLAAETQPSEPETAPDLPTRLEAALTERFTELGNPCSQMSRHEKGPDGWPASHPVGPRHVAEVLRELLAAAAAVGQTDTEATPCGPTPDVCDAEAGEPCANHEREQAHAEGEHCFCGPECTP